MKLFILLPLAFCLLQTSSAYASQNHKSNSVCDSYADGRIDALQTLEALNLNIDDYSIGVDNTARIFCA